MKTKTIISLLGPTTLLLLVLHHLWVGDPAAPHSSENYSSNVVFYHHAEVEFIDGEGAEPPVGFEKVIASIEPIGDAATSTEALPDKVRIEPASYWFIVDETYRPGTYKHSKDGRLIHVWISSQEQSDQGWVEAEINELQADGLCVVSDRVFNDGLRKIYLE